MKFTLMLPWRLDPQAFEDFNRWDGAVYRLLEQRAVGPTQGRVKAMAISNLGKMDGKFPPCGAFGLSRLRWGISEHGIGHYCFVGASSWGGRLDVTVTAMDPLVSPERGRRILHGILARLAEAAEAPDCP
jgi:hypothetical protein